MKHYIRRIIRNFNKISYNLTFLSRDILNYIKNSKIEKLNSTSLPLHFHSIPSNLPKQNTEYTAYFFLQKYSSNRISPSTIDSTVPLCTLCCVSAASRSNQLLRTFSRSGRRVLLNSWPRYLQPFLGSATVFILARNLIFSIYVATLLYIYTSPLTEDREKKRVRLYELAGRGSRKRCIGGRA